jgi:hypothetical protein
MRTYRFFFALAAALTVVVAAPRPVLAQIQCTTDTDCPGATCGSLVCQWTVAGHACVPAGTDPEGYDGWCTIDSNCKCAGQGATCTSQSHCSFTLSQDAGASTSSSGSSTGGTTSTPGAAGCSMKPGAARGDEYALAIAFAALTLMRRRQPGSRGAA